ncbi:MAG: hypothetical protein ACRDRK_02405, partial [Pseudonocardia sp.]
LGRQVCAVAPTLSSARVRARLGELALAIRGRPRTEATAGFLADIAMLDSGRAAEVITTWPV